MSETPRAAFCPECGAPATGKFCSSCGNVVPMPGTPAPRVAQPTSAPPPTHRSHSRTWTGVSLVAVVAVALVLAARSLTPGPAAPPDSGGGMGGGPAGGGAGGGAPDISQMSPAQRAQLLHDLVLRAYQGRHIDTVARFSPMAIAAYQMLDSMSLSQRYDLGRVALAAGHTALAAAEADTILTRHGGDVLGLVLAADAAHAANDAAAERKYLARLHAAAPRGAAAATGAEYSPYRTDIETTLGRAAGK